VEYSDVGLSRSYYYMCSVKHKGIVNCFKVQQFSKLPIEFNADENEAVRAQSLQWHILYKCPRSLGPYRSQNFYRMGFMHICTTS